MVSKIESPLVIIGVIISAKYSIKNQYEYIINRGKKEDEIFKYQHYLHLQGQFYTDSPLKKSDSKHS